ncbi:hypothetical protein H5J25_09585 [Sphingomonas aliaeris]|uniref:DUF4393 domain-containing protein n=1 Tax=Sphingomonas aliaeris TaxID=2759526 RepID=A0A974S2S4_9SPHN|nr:hypothetical protein [Sphingomonas aliaeris]QQV75868.1 hypothetical protein H5J25_09585 [Sphingomonas aliaeris]
MSEGSQFPISISGTIPEPTVRRLGESIADLVSPITEAAGMLGDSIRGHREAATTKRIQAAMKRAEDLQLPLKPAPVKFVASWSDSASLEADGSTLNRLWENLLLSGLSDYKSHLNAFIEVLRRFGPDEARCLKAVIDRAGDLNMRSVSVPQAAETNEFPHWLVPSGKYTLPNEIWAETLRVFEDHPKLGPTILGGYLNQENGRYYFYEPLFLEQHVSFDMLRKEGLIALTTPTIAIHSLSFAPQSPFGPGTYGLHLAHLTQLGFAFAKSCMVDLETSSKASTE